MVARGGAVCIIISGGGAPRNERIHPAPSGWAGGGRAGGRAGEWAGGRVAGGRWRRTLGSSTSARSSWEDWADELPRHTTPAFSVCAWPHTSDVCVWSGATNAAESETRESMGFDLRPGAGLGVRGALARSRGGGVRACATQSACRAPGVPGVGVVTTKARSPIRPNSSKGDMSAVSTHSRRAFYFLKYGPSTRGISSSSTPPNRAATRAACGR